MQAMYRVRGEGWHGRTIESTQDVPAADGLAAIFQAIEDGADYVQVFALREDGSTTDMLGAVAAAVGGYDAIPTFAAATCGFPVY